MRTLPSLIGLEAFEATARLGSVSRAAEELNLTQGAVSRQIIALEQRLKVTLFARKNRRLILSEAGAAYLSEVEIGLGAIKSATSSLVARHSQGGSLAVATLPTFGASWLLPRLPHFVERYPDISLTLTSRPEPFDFAFERVDCAIHFGGPEWPGAETECLFNERMVAVASPRLAQQVETAKGLLRVPLLHISTRAFGWRDWLTAIGEEGLEIKPRYVVDTFAMALELVRAELAVAVLPTFLVDNDLSEGRLETILGARVESALAYHFVVPNRHRKHFAVKAFGAWLRDQVAG